MHREGHGCPGGSAVPAGLGSSPWAGEERFAQQLDLGSVSAISSALRPL